ncbi:cytosine deaminase [Mesorhizobium huakuii]|uniref:amidohydrolase family protein n=1 Tax=Mesorhizobium huakuii TaxID=28104 RepID=UPI00235C7F23|nr:amidohydrolase family protein [Mesorhizobium huakuii]GLQ78849.1 cytosine deaminase [Mesorhizobium huakuii]
MQASKRAYRGRVVQMDAAFSVLADAIIWIEGNRIVAVTDASVAPPPGLEHLSPVVTGGTFFPGLIELHNHLAYDILKLWAVPKPYKNRAGWQGKPEYQALVSGPMTVLGKAPGIAPAIARYTEAKCLVGGTTTSQGLTLFSAAGIKRKYRGLVRNAEESLDANLPDAQAQIPDFAASKKDIFLKYLKTHKCMLLHLSEGIDASARKHFLDLRIGPNEWAIAPSLTGIHCNALHREDFDRLAQVGAGMVWSPLSNLMLYGQTADIVAAKAAGLRIGIGSDWSPTGSKNLLHEMKVIWQYSQTNGGLFSQRDIVAMATIGAAGLLRWDRYLGSIEAGKYADLMLVRGNSGDPYASLIKADETQVDLVVIDGVPRYATLGLAAGFSATSEEISFAGEKRLVNLDDASADEAVAGLGLAKAQETLSQAMADLAGMAEHAVAFERMAPTLRAKTLPPQAQWTLVLDQDEPHDLNLRPRFTDEAHMPLLVRLSEAATPLAKIVPSALKPQKLDPLTVAGDPDYYPSLQAQMNIPAAIKQGLHG